MYREKLIDDTVRKLTCKKIVGEDDMLIVKRKGEVLDLENDQTRKFQVYVIIFKGHKFYDIRWSCLILSVALAPCDFS